MFSKLCSIFTCSTQILCVRQLWVAIVFFHCTYLYGYFLFREDDVLFSMKDRYMKFHLKEVFKQEKQPT